MSPLSAKAAFTHQSWFREWAVMRPAGSITDTAAEMFPAAGLVIMFGTLASVIYGIILMLGVKNGASVRMDGGSVPREESENNGDQPAGGDDRARQSSKEIDLPGLLVGFLPHEIVQPAAQNQKTGQTRDDRDHMRFLHFNNSAE